MQSFKLEEYLGQYEFDPTLEMMGTSDLQGWDMKDILKMANPTHQKLWDNLNLGYTEVRGHPLLQKEILKTYKKPQEILVTSGAEEALYATLKGMLNPSDHVIVMSPCYQSHSEIPSSLGCQVSEWQLKMNENWQPNLSELQNLIQKNTKLIIMCMPHNPTGMICSQEAFQKIIQLAQKHNIYLLNDEVYYYMEHDEKDRLPHIADAYNKGISINVMTKAYGLAGLRIGWVVSQDTHVIEQAEKIKHYLSICSSAPSEILAMIALDNREQILRENKNYMLKNLALFNSFIQKHSNLFEWVEPQGGCIGLVKLKEGNADAFCDEVREKVQCLLLPGSVFNLEDSYFRVGFGRRKFPEMLARLEIFIKQR